MNEARGTYHSLFARPAAATNRAGEATPAEPRRTEERTGMPRRETVIDLRSIDAARAAGPARGAPGDAPSRRSLWLAARPVSTEMTRPLPPGLFSLTAPARAHR